jgi:outer membrane protein assembly factor BamA
LKDLRAYIMLICLVLMLFPSLPGSQVAAQLFSTPAEEDSVSFAILPGMSYNSDVGLYGGVKLNHYDFRGGIEPYRSFRVISLAASTRGLLSAQFNSDMTRTFGTNIRSDVQANINRFPQDTFFGIGNDTQLDTELWEDDYYYFTSFAAGGTLNVRIPLNGYLNKKRLDIVPGIGINYEKPYTNSETLMETDFPAGFGGGWFNTIAIGMNWENRDNELIPSRGNNAVLSINGSHPFLGSDFTGANITAQFTQFVGFRVLLDQVLAMRISYNQALGEVPYWMLPSLGGETTLRGFAFRRFRDNASVNLNTELRTWFFHHEEIGIRLGGQLFIDSGRVFDAINATDLFGGYHTTYGFGGAISLGRRDIFIRVDFGFSEEMVRYYAGIGYMF